LERFRGSRSDAIKQVNSLTEGHKEQSGSSVAIDLHAAAVRTLSLAHDLSDAIEGGQLALFYQPIVSMQGRQRVGYEALVRWQHPRLGLISPDEFIPLAEKTGLIHRIGHWVLHQAALDWKQLRTLCSRVDGHEPFMSVNLSAPELSAEGIVERIARRAAEQGMAPGELRIELTETIIISNVSHVSRSVQALRDLGIGIALDDFGTGYAGLDYLQTLPFSCLKIDKSFVQQMHTAERSFQIIRSALELSRTLGLTTVAEGIEDAATADELQSLGCTYAQGYHFGRPLPLAQAITWNLP
jgi:EAL domain-containing protein (putative c-di-GMP-specific phosphodiesterase class I)